MFPYFPFYGFVDGTRGAGWSESPFRSDAIRLGEHLHLTRAENELGGCPIFFAGGPLPGPGLSTRGGIGPIAVAASKTASHLPQKNCASRRGVDHIGGILDELGQCGLHPMPTLPPRKSHDPLAQEKLRLVGSTPRRWHIGEGHRPLGAGFRVVFAADVGRKADLPQITRSQ